MCHYMLPPPCGHNTLIHDFKKVGGILDFFFFCYILQFIFHTASFGNYAQANQLEKDHIYTDLQLHFRIKQLKTEGDFRI